MDKDITIQVNPPNKGEKYANLSTLIKCLDNDPDLALLPPEKRGTIPQTLFITSGSDYTSYFSGYGKASFLNTFFQNSTFITGNSMDGCLSQTREDNDSGFLAFLRLIGCLYYKKHWSAFVSRHNCETPQQLFQLASGQQEDRHIQWMDMIRKVVSDMITSEEERLPSLSALRRHWNRTCWVQKYWQNATNHDVQKDLPSPENSGWRLEDDGTYMFDWDSHDQCSV